MGRAIHVPITPAVLRWAIRESGYTTEQVADKAHVSTADIEMWLHEQAQPTVTQFRSLAKTLKRTPATLLLPEAPETTALPVQFRHPPNADRTKPSADE